MKDISAFFGSLGNPVCALIIYKNNQYDCGTAYVEQYNFDASGKAQTGIALDADQINELSKILNYDEEGKVFLKPAGLLPKNVLYVDYSNSPFALWTTPAKKVYLSFKKELELPSQSFPIPRLIWRAWKDRLEIFAVKDDDITSQTPLYHSPFLNVSAFGNVCMGSVNLKFKHDCSLENFIKLWQRYFFGSTFTHANEREALVEGNIFQLWKRLASLSTFPLEVLKPVNKNLQSLLS